MASPIDTSLASGFARASQKYWAAIDEIEQKYCHGPKSGLVVDLETMQLMPDDDDVALATGIDDRGVYDYIYNDASVSAHSGIWRDRVNKTTNAST